MFHAVGITPRHRPGGAFVAENQRTRWWWEERRSETRFEKSALQKTTKLTGSIRLSSCDLGADHKRGESPRWEKDHRDVHLILATSEPLRALAQKTGLVDGIQTAEATSFRTCALWVSRDGRFRPGTGWDSVSDSAGAAHLLKVMGVPVWFGSIEQGVKAAITGRWEEA